MFGVLTYSIGDVARLSGTTVRTLHHYDRIGLVKPAGRTDAGYRMYERADLERLQEVLLFRELDVPLTLIGKMVEADPLDRTLLLEEQHAALLGRRRRLDHIIATVEASLEELKGIGMTDNELFGGFDPDEYKQEVEERWGETDAYKESQRRTGSYTPDDWKAIGAELEAIEAGLAELLVAGVSPEDDQAVALAEVHRVHIDRWFYPCTTEMHAMLADGYVSDPRFTKHYEERQEGLAAFVRDAVYANGLR